MSADRESWDVEDAEREGQDAEREKQGADREEEYDREDQDSLRARSEQAITEFAQVLLDSQVLENAVAAAFGAREKAVEAQHAAMAALDLASASEVERLERRLRVLSERLEDVEDQVDRVARDVGAIRRQLAERSEPSDEPRAQASNP